MRSHEWRYYPARGEAVSDFQTLHNIIHISIRKTGNANKQK